MFLFFTDLLTAKKNGENVKQRYGPEYELNYLRK